MKQLRCIVAALLVAGCGADQAAGPAAAPLVPTRVTLHVAAASDLQLALPELVEIYERQAPDVAVVTTFGPSGQLAEQVKAGAPFALFLSANKAYVQDLVASGAIRPGSDRPYAVGSLVVVTNPLMKAPLESLDDLSRHEYRRIAIANPETAPYGAAARQALQKSGLWGKLRLSLVFAESVRQALQFVETGNAEAGLVGKAVAPADRFRVLPVDPNYFDPIVQWLGVVAKVPEDEAAEADRFAAFLLSDVGAGVLSSHGFLPAAAAAAAEPAPPATAGGH